MGTDDNGYELAVCRQLGKAAKLCTGTRFSTDSPPVLGIPMPRFRGYLCGPCYSAPPFFREAGERTVNRRVYRKIFDRFDLSQISDYKELWKVNRNDKTYFSNG